MTTKPTSRRKNVTPKTEKLPHLAVFPTDCGWFALRGCGTAVAALTIGHGAPESARDAALRIGSPEQVSDVVEADWHPALRQRLQRFAQGERVDFRDIDVALPPMTPFQRAVVRATRAIEYGHTQSYAELALAAGYPRAARAVGNVMASNRVPIIIPCHRVVAAAGRLGGFSAPQGTDLKRRLLAMEAAT